MLSDPSGTWKDGGSCRRRASCRESRQRRQRQRYGNRLSLAMTLVEILRDVDQPRERTRGRHLDDRKCNISINHKLVHALMRCPIGKHTKRQKFDGDLLQSAKSLGDGVGCTSYYIASAKCPSFPSGPIATETGPIRLGPHWAYSHHQEIIPLCSSFCRIVSSLIPVTMKSGGGLAGQGKESTYRDGAKQLPRGLHSEDASSQHDC